MDSLPDAILPSIFTSLYSAREIALYNCVSKRWKDSLRYLRTLYFPRSAFEKHTGHDHSDTIVLRMIAALDRLEKLVVYSPFTSKGLASWLVIAGSSLKQIELRMDNTSMPEYQSFTDNSPSKMDCLAYARNVESMKLWGVLMTEPPKWDTFKKLHTLEIVGARLKDSALTSALKGCPNLKTLVLLGCEGNQKVSIDLPHLERCKMAFHGQGNCSFSLNSPKIEDLEVHGCSWIGVPHSKCLKNLTISNEAGRVYMVDFGELTALESLTIRGVQWCWDAISTIINLASEVKHLFMKVEFTGDIGSLDPFPEVDFVEFFNSHPKLRKFEIHGAMFAALCHKNSLINLESGFVIPNLEEVVIQVRSPLKAEQKINILESLIKYGKNLKTMTIRILEMKSSHGSADDFFADICRFQHLNRKIVRIA